MAELHDIEKRGIAVVIERLQNNGRRVEPSSRKTFDLVVDGVQAEVKCKQLPWGKLDFIGLTDKQRQALDKGEHFLLFIVCNLIDGDPAKAEVKEFESKQLRDAKFKTECTHYINALQLKALATRT